MTEPIEIVRLREQIAKLIFNHLDADQSNYEIMTHKALSCANKILALTKPDGTKAIGVIADEQELPDTWRDDTPEKAQRDMLKAGWKKVVE